MAQTIVVGTDGSAPAERAVREAIEIAAKDGAQLHLVSAFPDPAMFREQIPGAATTMQVNLREVAESVLARHIRDAEARGVQVETHAREGNPAEAILDTATEVKADLIVVGNRGLSGIQRFLLGSVSQKVSEHASCNVLIIRPDQGRGVLRRALYVLRDHPSMPKIVYYCASSLDGYIADADDGIDWLMGYEGSFDGDDLSPGPLAEGGSYDQFYAGVGALVSGSVSYDFILGHVREGNAWPYPDRPYWVLSSRDLPIAEGAEDVVHIVNTSVRELIDELNAAAGERDIWIVGGGNVASQFADEGLLDELHVTIVPVVLGAGKPLFDRALSGAPLHLLGTRTYANGMVELRYARR